MTSPSARITSLHVAFLPVDSHLPLRFLWVPGHLQTTSVRGLLPRGKPALPQTITGLGGKLSSVCGAAATKRPRRRAAKDLTSIWSWSAAAVDLFVIRGELVLIIWMLCWWSLIILLFTLLHNRVCYIKCLALQWEIVSEWQIVSCSNAILPAGGSTMQGKITIYEI